MQRRNFLRFAGLLPAIGIFKANNVFGLTPFFNTTDSQITKPTSVDSLFSDFPKGSLVVIGARPSMGKSALLIKLLDHYAVTEKNSVAFFSLEQSKEELVKRWFNLKKESYVTSGDKVKEPQKLWDEHFSIFEAIANSEALLDDTLVSVQDIRRKVETAIQKGNKIEYVFVDYLQLVRTEGAYPSRLAQVQDILVQLKKLAVDLNLIVIASAQLNRGIDSRSNRRPVPNDLREIRDLSQIDELVLLYRDSSGDGLNRNCNLELFKFKKPFLKSIKCTCKLDLLRNQVSMNSKV